MIVADVALVTAEVDMENVALLAFAGTVTLAGICAAELLSERLTVTPPVGAGPVRVTVPVEELPPTTVVGFRVRPESAGGVTVSEAVRVVPLYVADIVTVVELEVGALVTEKLAVLAFAATVTLAGVAVTELLSERFTTIPPAGAAAFRVTVPVDEFPPAMLVGLMLTDASHGLIVRVAVRVVPL